jgi:hypothetical protein
MKAHFAETMRLLEERAAYWAKKAAEAKQRGQAQP